MKFYIHSNFTDDAFVYKTQSLLSYILPRVKHGLCETIIVDELAEIVPQQDAWCVVPCTGGYTETERYWPENFVQYITAHSELNVLLDYSGEPHIEQEKPTALAEKCLELFSNRAGHTVFLHGTLGRDRGNHIGMPGQFLHHSIFSKEHYTHFHSIDNQLIRNVFDFATHDFLCLNGRSDSRRTAIVNRFLDAGESIIYSLNNSELSNWGSYIFGYLNRSIPIEKVLDSKIYVATETIVGADHLFISEKTAKAFSMGKPFVIMGPKNIHKQLRDWGFDLFTDTQHETEIDDFIEWTYNQAVEIKQNYSAENYLASCLYNLTLFHSETFHRKLLHDYLLLPLDNIRLTNSQ